MKDTRKRFKNMEMTNSDTGNKWVVSGQYDTKTGTLIINRYEGQVRENNTIEFDEAHYELASFFANKYGAPNLAPLNA